jgi:transcription factor S
MQFCPKCGSLLKLKPVGQEKVLSCTCGYVERAAGNIRSGVNNKDVREHNEVAIIDEEVSTLPLTDAECPKCKHQRAYYWTIQTRAGDEPETKFLKCEKCGHTWREYD